MPTLRFMPSNPSDILKAGDHTIEYGGTFTVESKEDADELVATNPDIVPARDTKPEASKDELEAVDPTPSAPETRLANDPEEKK